MHCRYKIVCDGDVDNVLLCGRRVVDDVPDIENQNSSLKLSLSLRFFVRNAPAFRILDGHIIQTVERMVCQAENIQIILTA